MSAGKDAAPTEYQRIAEELASSKAHKAQEDSAEAANKLRQRQFKASHAIIIIFLLWIVYVLMPSSFSTHLRRQLSPRAWHLFLYERLPPHKTSTGLQVGMR